MRVYVHYLPSLEAKDSIRRVHESALGAGTMKKEDASQVWNRWHRLADGEGGGKPRRRLSLEQTAQMAAASGIGVRIVKPKQDTP